MLPPTARRRRQLLAEQENSSNSSSSSSSSSSSRQVPDWVASDPVWQVAQPAAAAGMSEHSASGASAAETDESHQVAETAALWANFTASGGSLLPSWSLGDSAASGSGSGIPGAALGVRSLDLSTEDGSSFEDAPLPDPPAYDGSEGRADEQHRRAVAAANYSTASDSGRQEEWAAAAAAAQPSGRSAGGRRLAESYFSGPAAGTILSWM